MAGDKLRLVSFMLVNYGSFIGTMLVQRLRAMIHRLTYKGPGPHPKTVVVVGGSFAGVQLVRRLADTLPTGWQAVLVERNSHFNFAFAFPQLCVVPGEERSAFIPYGAIFASAPRGSVRLVQDGAVRLTADAVELASRGAEPLKYDMAVVATGTAQPPPAKLLAAADREKAIGELKALQQRIRAARTIAVVGGGAVGVELAADIKSWKVSDDKNGQEVTLVHSRPQLLPRFGPRLHEHVLGVLEKTGVRVVLGQRPKIVRASDASDASDAAVGGPGTLAYADGREEKYDCILLCTGQKPNSAVIKDLCPGAIAASSGEITVAPTLQVSDGKGGVPRPNVFAFGDVAATGGPKMARAAFLQAEVIMANVAALIKGQPPVITYKIHPMEGATKLTLGKEHGVMYIDPGKGQDILIPTGSLEDGMVEHGWKLLGAKYSKELVA